MGQYLLLLLEQFSSKEKQRIPTDQEELKRICGGTPSDRVLAKFPKSRNERMFREWREAKGEYEGKRKGGGKRTDTGAVSGADSAPKPRTKTQDPKNQEPKIQDPQPTNGNGGRETVAGAALLEGTERRTEEQRLRPELLAMVREIAAIESEPGESWQATVEPVSPADVLRDLSAFPARPHGVLSVDQLQGKWLANVHGKAEAKLYALKNPDHRSVRL